MTNLSSTAASILRPEQVNDLIIQPLTEQSVAMRVSNIVYTSSSEYRIPVLEGDPAADWTAEGADITPDDADFDEVLVTPKKAAALTIVSNELAADSTPAATGVLGQRLVQSLVRKVDAAFFGSTVANGPNGIGSISPTTVYAGGDWTDSDVFLEAVAAVETLGQKIDTFVAHPDDALALARIKKLTSGSNEPLLAADATLPAGRQIAGVPLVVSADVPAGVVYGIPKATTFTVIREDASVQIDSSAYFASDRTAVRATIRVGFGFAYPASIVAVVKAAEGS